MPDADDIFDDEEDLAQFAPKARPQPPDQPVVKSDFDRWFYSQMHPTYKLAGNPVPMATVLMYQHLGAKPESFGFVIDFLEAAFKAGKESREP